MQQPITYQNTEFSMKPLANLTFQPESDRIWTRFQQRLQRVEDQCSILDPTYKTKWKGVKKRGKIQNERQNNYFNLPLKIVTYLSLKLLKHYAAGTVAVYYIGGLKLLLQKPKKKW